MFGLIHLAGKPGEVRLRAAGGIVLALAFAAMAALSAGGLAHAQGDPASTSNVSFETGDLTGWGAEARCDNVDGDGCGVPPGYVKAVQSFGPENGTEGPGKDGADLFQTYTAPYGQSFAVLQAGCLTTTLSRTFTLKAGQTLTGKAFFATDEDYGLNGHTYNDSGRVEIVSGGTVKVLFSSDAQSVRAFNGTPWTAFTFTATAAGDYTLQASVDNFLNCTYPSWVGIDLAAPLCTTVCYVDAAKGNDAGNGGTSTLDAFKTIQRAVDTVASGGKVIVAAGTYAESIQVHRPVTLEGAGAGKDARERTDAAAESVISAGPGLDGVTVFYTPSVTIDGFTFSGNAAGIAFRGYSSSSSYQIVDNIFTANTQGIAFGGGNYRVVIQQNVFDSNNAPTPIGNSFVRSGVGIGGGGYLYNSTVSDNTFSGQSRADVTIRSVGG